MPNKSEICRTCDGTGSILRGTTVEGRCPVCVGGGHLPCEPAAEWTPDPAVQELRAKVAILAGRVDTLFAALEGKQVPAQGDALARLEAWLKGDGQRWATDAEVCDEGYRITVFKFFGGNTATIHGTGKCSTLADAIHAALDEAEGKRHA